MRFPVTPRIPSNLRLQGGTTDREALTQDGQPGPAGHNGRAHDGGMGFADEAIVVQFDNPVEVPHGREALRSHQKMALARAVRIQGMNGNLGARDQPPSFQTAELHIYEIRHTNLRIDHVSLFGRNEYGDD